MTGSSVLVVGSGGREHAIAWALSRSPRVSRLYVAPGNAGTSGVAENVPIAATDVTGLVRFVKERDVHLTVVGPEAPLALGLVDLLAAQGRRAFGPSAAAARIEASKSFAKGVMREAGIPTAGCAVFENIEPARAYVADASYPLVIKADGLAAGKGVTICSDEAEAREVLHAWLVDRVLGEAGARVVVEEALQGPEVSLLAFTDGERVVPLPVAQDHKRLGTGDLGPNTGGMGAYAPVPFMSPAERDHLARVLLEPVVDSLRDRGSPYRGVLYAGLMLTPEGPRVLEFNCRLGDPETQAILPLLAEDLFPWLEAAAVPDGLREAPASLQLTGQAAVGVVLAAPGYPHSPRLGTPIEGLDGCAQDTLVFHAGTRHEGGQIVTSGGRVLTVVGTGRTFEEAAALAYTAPIRFEGMQRRGDIGRQARREAVHV